MDVIKKNLLVVLKFQFWILSGLVLIAASIVFFLTSSSLNALITSRTSALKSTYDKVNTISSSVSSHPNSHSHAEMDKSLVVLEKDIKEAWGIQYRGQIPLMEWPRKAFFQESTHKLFESLQPVEKFIEFPIPAALPPPYNKITLNDREVYKKYIGPEFASVSSIIRTEWKARLGGAGGSEPTSIVPPPDVVRWSAESQQTMLGQIVPWFDKGTAPSILEIYYTQEDMWLLKGIMDIIRRANGDARENFQTVVREIEWIRMGRFASRNAGVLTKMEIASANTGGMSSGMMGSKEGGMEDMMGSSGGSMDGDSGGSGGSGGFGETSAASDPADNRYISFATESLFQPRKGAELRESIKNAPTASNAVDAVAKRVAIRMRMKVDPANLSRLITECGNAGNKGLLLEVYQVRIGTDPAPATGAGGIGGSGGGMGGPKGAMGMGQGMSSGGMSSGGMSSGGSPDGEGGGSFGGTAAVSDDPDSEIAIEIFGLIYLYNPENIVTITNELTAEKTDSAPQNAATTPVAVEPKPETPALDPAAEEPKVTAESLAEPNTVQPKSDQPAASGAPEAASSEPATPTPAAGAPNNPSDN
jgi:hypothetical protein